MSWINKLLPWTTNQKKPFANDEAAQKAAAANATPAVKVTPHTAQTVPVVQEEALVPPLELEVRRPFIPVAPEQPPPLPPLPPMPPLDVVPEPVAKAAPAAPTVNPPLPIQAKNHRGRNVAAVLVAAAVGYGGYTVYNQPPKDVSPGTVTGPTEIEVHNIKGATVRNKATVSTPATSDKIDLQCQVISGQLPPIVVPPAPEPPKPVPVPVPPPAPEPPKPPPAPVPPPAPTPVPVPPAPVPPTPIPEPAAEFEPGTIVFGFKGLGGIFDEAAFKQFAMARGLTPIVVKPWESKAAINEFVTLQKDFKNPYALYGFSIGGQTALNAVKIIEALAKNNKPSAQPVAVFTIGSGPVIEYKGAFDKVRIVEHYFHANTKHDVDGKYIKAPHTGPGNIQQKVADLFKKG